MAIKQTAEIYEILSKGQFISSNSSVESVRKLFGVIEDNFTELSRYFSVINFTLERGDEYFYFSRPESRADLERKIESAYKWIDILDFFNTYAKSIDEPMLLSALVNSMLIIASAKQPIPAPLYSSGMPAPINPSLAAFL